ncbi:MAG: discoidin domain-containing protein [Flavobacteriales bacterium]|nr:discoidin domain-containing protein [Flavobacteriales bacterium]
MKKSKLMSVVVLMSFEIVIWAQTSEQLIRLHNISTEFDLPAIGNINSNPPYKGSLLYVSQEKNIYKYNDNQWRTTWNSLGNSNIDSQNGFIGTIENSDLRFRTNNAQRMVVKNDGKVGINLNNPMGRFQVNTASLTTNTYISTGTASSNANNWLTNGVPQNANDNLSWTYWTSANVAWNWVNYWYRIDLGENNAQVVNKYQIIKQFNHHHPTRWEFQGSNDNINWANLDVQHGSTTWNWGGSITRTFPNSTPYRYYRWFMHRGFYSGSGWSGGFSIKEFKLFLSGDPDGTNLTDDFIVATNGHVGVGIAPTEALHVNGNILASGTITPDYVFEKYYGSNSITKPNYTFNSLEEVKSYVKANKHLPNVASAPEIEQQGGIIVNKSTESNLEKIEELYLYFFEVKEKYNRLIKRLNKLQKLFEETQN